MALLSRLDMVCLWVSFPYAAAMVKNILHVTFLNILQDFLGKSDPYLEILKGNPDGSWQVVHRTEVSLIMHVQKTYCPTSE